MSIFSTLFQGRIRFAFGILAAACAPAIPGQACAAGIRETVVSWATEDAAMDRQAGRSSAAAQTEADIKAFASGPEIQPASPLPANLFPTIPDLEHNMYARDLFARVVERLDLKERFPKGEINVRTEARGWNYIVLSSEAHDLLLAFFHPQSKYRGDTRLLLRALRILDNGFDGWLSSGKTLADFGTFDNYTQDYLLLRTALPEAILPSKKQLWEKAIAANAAKVSEKALQTWTQPGPNRTYLNADVRYMNGILYAGAVLGRKDLTDLAAKGLIWNAGALLPDGGFNYLGNQTECFTYHEVDCFGFAAYYLFTGDDRALDVVRKTTHYYPLSIDPRGVAEYFTAPSWKYAWNPGRNEKSAALVACLTGDAQNFRLAENAGTDFLLACFYKPGLRPAPAPDNYLLKDGNIQGPRGKFGDYSFAAVLRDPSDMPVGTWGLGMARATIVGAMQLEPAGSAAAAGKFANWPVSAILNGVELGIRVKPDDGSASGGEMRASQRFLIQNIHGESIVRPSAAGVVANYHLSEKAGTGPEPFKALPWQGHQMWMMLPDRMVGWVELQAQSEQTALGVLGRIELLAGRGSWGVKKEVEALGDGRFRYGKFNLRLVDQNLGEPVAKKTAGIYAGANTAGDDKYQILYLDPPDTSPKKFDAGQSFHFVLELRSPAAVDEAKVENVKLPSGVWRLAVHESKRDLWLYYNPTPEAVAVAESLASSWRQASVQQASAEGRSLTVSSGSIKTKFDVPPGTSRLVLASDSADDHAAKSSTYEEVFNATGHLRDRP